MVFPERFHSRLLTGFPRSVERHGHFSIIVIPTYQPVMVAVSVRFEGVNVKVQFRGFDFAFAVFLKRRFIVFDITKSDLSVQNLRWQ